MKETRTINLNGIAFTIDYDAYQELRDYLHDIELRLSMDERNDVMADIEARMAELFSNALFAKNIQVVNMDIVHSVQARIGAPSEFGENKRPKVKHTKSDNSGCGRVFGIAVLVMLAMIAVPIVLPIMAGFIALIVSLFGMSVGLLGTAPFLGMELFAGNGWMTALFIVCGLAVIVLPIVMIICSIVSYMRTRRGPKARFWWITLALWLLSIVGTTILAVEAVNMGFDIKSFVQQITDDEDDEDLASEVRNVPAFNAIKVCGAADVTLYTGAEPQLIVRSNRLTDVVSEVQDSVLCISAPMGRYADLELDITAPTLCSINTSGACDIESDGILQAETLDIQCNGASDADLQIDVQTLNITISGGSDMDIQGTANQATITLSGAGDIDAEHLTTQTMHINCTGASEADINVQQELWAQATGASKITYRGNPSIKQKMEVGGSSIQKK